MADPLQRVMEERARQDAKWGSQRSLANQVWLTILTEEVGESAQEVLRFRNLYSSHEELKAEVTQVAAVALAWLEALEGRNT